MTRLLQAPVIDLKALLTACLDSAETRFRVVPEILAVRFPQHRDLLDDAAGEEAEEDLIWVQDELEGPWVSWGDGRVDLANCCARACSSADQAVFRLKAFVHYCGKPEEPRRFISSGHFVAFF